ncbi:MAG TPA: hypothetical protein VGE52_09090, partial [Pirellulales bacterium]
PVSGEPTASELPFQDGQAQDVAFSPNGDQILVWGRRAGTLRAWSLSRNAFVAPPGARSEDGAAVAVGHVQGVLALGQGGRVRLVDSLSGDDVLPATACRGRILALAAPESGGLVAVDQEGRVCRWRGPTDPPVVRRFVGGSRFVAAKLSLDGSRLLFASPDGRLSIVDLFADGAPRTLATGLDPRDPLALSQDGRWAGWIERRPAEPVTVVVAETGGAERGTFSLSGIPSGLGFAQIGDEMNAVAAAIPGRSPRSASGEPDRREAELVIGGRSGLVKSFALPDSPRLGWLTAFGDLGAVGYGRARLAVWNLAEGRRRLDRDLGEPPIAASFDPSSPRRVIVALANARLLGLDSAAGGAASLDLSRASSAATFARPQVVVEPERGDVLISDDNGVVYRFPWP